MATVRETVQAQIDSRQREIAALQLQLASADPAVKALLSADLAALKTLVSTWPALFAATPTGGG